MALSTILEILMEEIRILGIEIKESETKPVLYLVSSLADEAPLEQ